MSLKKEGGDISSEWHCRLLTSYSRILWRFFWTLLIMHVTSQCLTRSGFWYSWPCPSQLSAPPNFPSNRFSFSGGKDMKGSSWLLVSLHILLMLMKLGAVSTFFCIWWGGAYADLRVSASYCCFIAVSGWSSAVKVYKIEHFVLSSVWNWTDQ
jgi:hypothetical protein